VVDLSVMLGVLFCMFLSRWYVLLRVWRLLFICCFFVLILVGCSL